MPNVPGINMVAVVIEARVRLICPVLTKHTNGRVHQPMHRSEVYSLFSKQAKHTKSGLSSFIPILFVWSLFLWKSMQIARPFITNYLYHFFKFLVTMCIHNQRTCLSYMCADDSEDGSVG